MIVVNFKQKNFYKIQTGELKEDSETLNLIVSILPFCILPNLLTNVQLVAIKAVHTSGFFEIFVRAIVAA